MFLHQNSHFNNCVRILLNEDRYAQSIPLPKISLRTSPINEKSKVVCTLIKARYTRYKFCIQVSIQVF